MVCCIKEVSEVRPLKERVTITLDSDIVARLRELADEDARPFSQYINVILRKYLHALDKKKPSGE